MPAIVVGADGYYTGAITDVLPDLVVSPFGNRYGGFFVDGESFFTNAVIEGKGQDDLTVVDFGADASSASDLGVMLVYIDGAPHGRENDVVTIWSR